MERGELLRVLAALVAAVDRPHPVRVAIDGPDLAGKTTLADDLAPLVAGKARVVVRAGIDGFHRPRADRLRAGELSADGYFRDSFDLDALRRHLLHPLGPGGSRRFRRMVFDHRTDEPVDVPFERTDDNSVLLFDGVFLFRPELNSEWDVRVFLSIPPEEMLRRALVRDAPLLGSEEATTERYLRRYIPAQERYRAMLRPGEIADVAIDMSDPDHPRPLAP